jgi:ribosomal protein L22
MISPNDILITSLKREELKILQEIGISTFSETFEEINTPEDMKMYLEEKFNLQQLQKESENPESEFYLAWVNKKVAGYLKINTGSAQNENFMPNALEVERIYVLKRILRKRYWPNTFRQGN